MKSFLPGGSRRFPRPGQQGVDAGPEGSSGTALGFWQRLEAHRLADSCEVRVFLPVLENLENNQPGLRRA